MVLEATVLCVDNSEYSRNCDFNPNRLEAQRDTAVLFCGAAMNDNPENAVGLMSLGKLGLPGSFSLGDSEQRRTLQLAPTGDTESFNAAVAGIEIEGSEVELLAGIRRALLSLKHRANRNQKQRIVVFICSPLTCTEKELEALGKIVKKNNVSLDIVSFGEVQTNSRILHKLFDAVNSNNTSHIIEVETATSPLSQLVLKSAIAPGGPRASGGDEEMDEFGIDPAADPELYMALRMSLEEDRARQARLRQQEQAAGGGAAASGGSEAGGSEASRAGPHTIRTGDTTLTATAAEAQAGGPTISSRTQVLGDSHEIITSDADPNPSNDNVNMDDTAPTVEDIMAMDIDEELRQALLLSLEDSMDERSRAAAQGDAAESGKREGQGRGEEASPQPMPRPQAEASGQGGAQETDSNDDDEGSSSGGSDGDVEDLPPEMWEELASTIRDVDINDPEVKAALQKYVRKKSTREAARTEGGADEETRESRERRDSKSDSEKKREGKGEGEGEGKGKGEGEGGPRS